MDLQAASYDEKNGKMLWEWSEKMVGLPPSSQAWDTYYGIWTMFHGVFQDSS